MGSSKSAGAGGAGVRVVGQAQMLLGGGVGGAGPGKRGARHPSAPHSASRPSAPTWSSARPHPRRPPGSAPLAPQAPSSPPRAPRVPAARPALQLPTRPPSPVVRSSRPPGLRSPLPPSPAPQHPGPAPGPPPPAPRASPATRRLRAQLAALAGPAHFPSLAAAGAAQAQWSPGRAGPGLCCPLAVSRPVTEALSFQVKRCAPPGGSPWARGPHARLCSQAAHWRVASLLKPWVGE